MVDLALLCILSWFAAAGWSRGFQRSLFDSLSYLISLLFLTTVIPFMQDHVLDSGLHSTILFKQENLLSGVMDTPLKSMASHAVTVFSSQPAFTTVSQWMLLEWYMIVLVCAASLFTGIQMIWQVFRVAEAVSEVSESSRWMGAVVGTLIGLFLILYLVKLASPISWAIQSEAIDESIAHSFILHSLYQVIPW